MSRSSWWSYTFFLSAAILIGGLAFAVVLDQIYRFGLEQTNVLFVTVPLLVGVAATMLPMEMHPIWKALLLVTLCLVESFFLFGEGAICVLMAAPLFYGFAILGALIVHVVGRQNRGQRAFAIVALPLFSLVAGPPQPAPPAFAEATIFVENVSPEEIEARLAAPRELDEVPWVLSLFPTPVESLGSGLEIGDGRSVYFAGGEGQPGWFEVAVVERAPGLAVTELVRDDSHLAHWLAWDREEISWEEVEGGTQVTWRVEYRNKLSPDWYFGPAEAWAVEQAAAHLLATTTAPFIAPAVAGGT